MLAQKGVYKGFGSVYGFDIICNFYDSSTRPAVLEGHERHTAYFPGLRFMQKNSQSPYEPVVLFFCGGS